MTRLAPAVALACAAASALARSGHSRLARHASSVRGRSGGWTLQDDYTPEKIISDWTFETQDWDSSSAATYVDHATAVAGGMAKVENGSAYLGVDTTATVSGSRNALRISTGTYNVGNLVLADVQHAPATCGVWPAFWMTTREEGGFATGGEIDIAEYYHLSTKNSFSVHTGSGCNMGQTGYSGTVSLGVPEGLNCDADATDNAGCAVLSDSDTSAGAGINPTGGGIYAIEWTTSGISMWFIPRGSITDDITSGSPDPSQWGTPSSFVDNASCDVSEHFKDLEIIINTELCGSYPDTIWNDTASLEWLGQEGGSCATKTGYSTCAEYVQSEGPAFADAYWLINSVKTYTTA